MYKKGMLKGAEVPILNIVRMKQSYITKSLFKCRFKCFFRIYKILLQDTIFKHFVVVISTLSQIIF